MDMTPQTWPEWYDGRHINEVLFCQQFLDKHPMKCVRGRLFTVDGLIEDEGQMQKRSCCRRSTDWRKRRPETESRSAKPEREGSFRRARFWKRYCRKCGR